MAKFDIKTRDFNKAKDAALWLLENTNFKFSAIYHFFGLHANSLTNWQKQLNMKKIIAPTNKNDYVDEFLKSKFNNSNYKKFDYLNIDTVSEIKWVIKNYGQDYNRYVIAQFYEIDENYVSQLKSGYAWENIIEQEPSKERKDEIKNNLNMIDEYVRDEIKKKKEAASWLLLFTNLELYQISHLLNLSYLHIYRLYLLKKKDKFKLAKICENINNIIYNYDFSTGEYFYNINYKYKRK